VRTLVLEDQFARELTQAGAPPWIKIMRGTPPPALIFIVYSAAAVTSLLTLGYSLNDRLPVLNPDCPTKLYQYIILPSFYYDLTKVHLNGSSRQY